MPKSKMLQVRLSEDEKQLLDTAAKQANMCTSDFVRSRIFTKDKILEMRVAELTDLVQQYASDLREIKALRDEEYVMFKKLLAILIISGADTEDIFTELEEIKIEKECLNVQSLIAKYRERGQWI